MKLFKKKPRVEIDAFDLVDISLMMHTVVHAGLGKKEFLDRLTIHVKRLQKEYKAQLTPKEMGEVAEKIMKKYKVKLN